MVEHRRHNAKSARVAIAKVILNARNRTRKEDEMEHEKLKRKFRREDYLPGENFTSDISSFL